MRVNVLQFTCFPWFAKCTERNLKAHFEARSCLSIRGVRTDGFAGLCIQVPTHYARDVGLVSLYSHPDRTRSGCWSREHSGAIAENGEFFSTNLRRQSRILFQSGQARPAQARQSE